MFTVQMSGARRRLGNVLYVLGATAGLALSLSGCQRGKASASAAAPPAPDVSVATVKPAQVLMQSSAISHEEFEAHRGEYEQGNADVQAAQAAVATAKLNLSFTEVRAPISGRAGRAVLTPGNLAQADQTLLTTLVSQDPVYVYFDCDEQSYLRYDALMRQQGHAAQGSPVRFALANESGFPH